MATAHIDTPHVYGALANILKNLSVAKGGVLPGNMGGKSYITAVDASAEVKRQFVENDLIFLPNEEVIENEHFIHKDRVSIRIVIRGVYTIVSTVDGSSVTVSGVGDGLATGTAVASNIGSTNALKNALLRTFLITEQSVEDAAKNGEPETPAQRQIQKAKDPRPAMYPPRMNAAAKDESPDVARLLGEIKAAVDSGTVTSDKANQTWNAQAKTFEKDGLPKRSVEVLEATKVALGI